MLSEFGLDVIGIRPYDEEMRNLLTFTIYPNPENKEESLVLTPVMGPPRREFADQESLEGHPIDVPGRPNYIVRLPITSLSRLHFTLDLGRWTRQKIRKLGWTEDGNRVFQADYPYPVNILYQFDVWTKYMSTANQILRQTMMKFINREAWMTVDLKGPFGAKSIPVELTEGPKNLTQLDSGLEERTVRFVFTFLTKAWIAPDYVSIPAIKANRYDLYIAEKMVAEIPEVGDLEPYPDWLKNNSVVIKVTDNDTSAENP